MAHGARSLAIRSWRRRFWIDCCTIRPRSISRAKAIASRKKRKPGSSVRKEPRTNKSRWKNSARTRPLMGRMKSTQLGNFQPIILRIFQSVLTNSNYGVQRILLALEQKGIKTSYSTVYRIMKKHGLLKKAKRHPNGLTREDAAA